MTTGEVGYKVHRYKVHLRGFDWLRIFGKRFDWLKDKSESYIQLTTGQKHAKTMLKIWPTEPYIQPPLYVNICYIDIGIILI